MKARLTILSLFFFLPFFLQAQCDEQFFSPNGNMILLTPEMFSYAENPYGDDPLGPAGVGNLADEQPLMGPIIENSSTTYPGGPSEVWNDYNYVGILDLGTEMDLYSIYLAVDSLTFSGGDIRITAGNINDPDNYDENNTLIHTSFQYLPCSRVYEFNLTNLINSPPDVNLGVRYLTIERLEGMETITEMAILGIVTPEEQIEISGCVNTECGAPVPDADVTLLEIPAQGNPVQQTQTTNQNGCYSFTNLNSGSNYFLSVNKTGQTTCGLDVYDRIAIQNHTSGGPQITSPYALLAADVNNDHVVDFSDYTYLSAMFVNNGNTTFDVDWKFVGTNIIFPDPTDPFNLATGSRSYQPLTASQFNQDFIGIKTGDVVCSYTDACPIDGISLSGCTLTSCNVAVPGAEVELIEIFNDGTISATLTDYTVTDQNGCYEFFRRTAGSQYIVSIAKADQIDCGVDGMDLSILQRHILFIEQIQDPLVLLAADLNRDSTINVTDLTLANFLVVNHYQDFLNNGGVPWTFVRRGHIFSNPANPFIDLPLNNWGPSVYNTDQSTLHFTAIKNGDLDCSYTSDCTTGDPGADTGSDDGGDDGGDEGGRRSDLEDTFNTAADKMSVKAQPNPFKESTSLSLELNQDGPVTIKIYNLLGKEIFSNEIILEAGTHSISLDRIPKTASGILPYVIEQNGNTISGKLIRVK